MKFLEALKAIVGEEGYLDVPAAMEPYLQEWRGRYRSKTPVVLRPDTPREVSEIVRICAGEGVGIVPQGGNTGLCGGAVAGEGGEQILLNLERLNQIREINSQADFLIAEAGCVLADVQRAAEAVDRLFPLSLSAEGTCQIGGNLSTDAGGMNVLRYGTARQQVLGLEVVLADGRIWHGLRTLRKNTAGYDLRNLFIGAEGTLGIITAAALRLYPRPRDFATALVALAEARDAVALLALMRGHLGEEISAFELISDLALQFVTDHIPDTRSPFDRRYSAYVLMETTASSPGFAGPRLESALETGLESGLILDAVTATDGRRREALWRLRHSISDAQRHEGVSIKHDISVPIDHIGEFLPACERAIADCVSGARVVVFGHVGDGNLHYNLSQPLDMEAGRFRQMEQTLNDIVFGLVHSFGGSFSAEHGVGLLRREQLRRYVDEVERDLMRRMKEALDPEGILNPGKVL